MRLHLVNTASKTDPLKLCEILPSLQLAWWKGGMNIGLFWLNFGAQLAFGLTLEESKKK